MPKLEVEAGVALVDRSLRGGARTLALTPAGRSLADQAEQLAAALASAEREVDRFKEQRGGTVRIGGVTCVLSSVVARAVVSVALTDPGIDPRIFEVDESDGLEQLTADELDLLLRLTTLSMFARHGTVTAAAQALHYSPSTVSHQVKQLSHELGSHFWSTMAGTYV